MAKRLLDGHTAMRVCWDACAPGSGEKWKFGNCVWNASVCCPSKQQWWKGAWVPFGNVYPKQHPTDDHSYAFLESYDGTNGGNDENGDDSQDEFEETSSPDSSSGSDEFL